MSLRMVSILLISVLPLASYAKCKMDYTVLPTYSNAKNFLAFANFGYRGIGRCRGHSIVTQKMEMLVRWNSRAPHPCDSLSETSCYDQLQELISEVLKGNIKEIGGFDSLYSFSQDPIARQILWWKVARTSNRFSSVEAPVKDDSFPNKTLAYFHEAAQRTSKRQRPYLAIEGRYRLGAHALLAYKLQTRGKHPVICIRDPNVVLPEPATEDCQNFIYVQDDTVYYHQMGYARDEELKYLSIQTDEDNRVQDYIRLHFHACQKRGR
jgi:hypothetical protein